MRNKAFRVNEKQGSVSSGQFGNGPLPNWDLNIHRPDETFRIRAGELL
jgi:hypothetical protein